MCFSLLVLICAADIVLFVGRAIRSGSHFIDWRDTWGPSLIGEGFPHKSSPQKSHESNYQYLRSHPARGEHMFRIWTSTGLPPSPAKHDLCSYANWARSASTYVATCLLTEKRSGTKIDGGFVSKKIVGLMCQDKR